MTAHPALETMLRNQAKVHAIARPNVVIFKTADDAMNSLLGNPQQDAHCKPWRWHKFCQETYGFTPDYSRRLSGAR